MSYFYWACDAYKDADVDSFEYFLVRDIKCDKNFPKLETDKEKIEMYLMSQYASPACIDTFRKTYERYAEAQAQHEQ